MSRGPVCVIGVSGFVGSHVAAALLAAGHSVRGTLRDPSAANRVWLEEGVGSRARDGATLELCAAELSDAGSIRSAMEGCSGVAMCAGVETQAPETIDLMVGAANHVADAALALGIGRAVFTSSTGSTNPPEGEPPRKNEVDHWSDPDAQIAAGKFSPAAKTLMDRTALERMEASEGRLRVATLNPSLIAGPAYQPDPVPSLRFFEAIVSGKRMNEQIPDGSMSMIHVEDLAGLHVAALERPEARGRYFGVQQSWHWKDILEAVGRAVPGYTPPLWPEDAVPSRPTQFDFTRRDALGAPARGIDEIVGSVVEELRRRRMIG